MNKLKKRKNKSIIILIAICFLLLNSEKSFAAAVIDDEYEENDTLSEATSITSGFYDDLCQADPDWYELYLGGRDEIILKLFFDNDDILMTFDLFEDGDYEIAYSTNQTGFLIIQWMNNNYPKFVYLQVAGPNNGDLYDLEIVIREGEDSFEQNDNLEAARGLRPGNFDGLVQYDDDWFVYRSINENEKIKVEMNYSIEESLEIEFTNEDGIPYDYSLKNESWGREIVWTADGDDLNVYIHVYGNSTGVHYGLDLSLNESSIPGYQLGLFLFICLMSSIWIFRKKSGHIVVQSNRTS